MDIIAMISNAARATAEMFGFAKQRDAEKNAPDVKAAAIAKQVQTELDEINRTVADRNAAQMQKDLAE